MKKHLFILLVCSLSISAFCQTNDYVFYTSNNDKFTLYLNNVKQNTTANNNVKATNISGKNVAIRVDFERSGVPDFKRTLAISETNKEVKIQLVKGREDIYSMKIISKTARIVASPASSSSSAFPNTETREEQDKHGNHNNGHGNNHNNNGHGNNGYGNNHNNGGYGNNGHGNNHGNAYNNQPGVSDNSRCNIAMRQSDFNTFRNQISARPFDNTRLTVAKQACMHNCLTADQIANICRLFSYESTRLNFAKYAYDYCYDRYRYFLVGRAFVNSASVDELNRYISSRYQVTAPNHNPYGNNGGYIQCDNPYCRYFMNDYDFNDLRNMINNTPYSSTKMTIAKQACSSNCMSSEQIREICRLFSFDSDRLEYAKFAYDYCYDRRNYYKVNEVFAFSYSINELNRYISNRN